MTVRLRRFGVDLDVGGIDSGVLERELPDGPVSTRRTTSSPVSVSVASEAGRHVVRRDGEVVRVLVTRDEAQEAALDELEHAIAEHSPFVFLHAGVVTIGGVALVIPGRSGAGKTTLVRALLGAGATYYSDEFAVLDLEGSVWPYARPLRVRGGGGVARVPAEEVGAAVGAGPAPVGAVLLTAYEPASSSGPFVRLGDGEAVLALLDHAYPARSRPGDAIDALKAVATGGVVLTGPRGDAAVLARRLVDELPWVRSG